MTDNAEQRSRDLECDRLLSAGLCMAAVCLAAARHLPRLPFAAALIEPGGASPVIAPIVVLGCVLFASVAFIVGADAKRRPAASLAIVLAAASTAVAVPFLHQGLSLFFDGISPAKAGAAIAFPVFGLTAAIASQEKEPTPAHFRRSAALTVVALFMAAIDGDGIFACILAAMGILFFSLGNRPART